MQKTKIIATIGPSSNNYETLLYMAEAGMNIARLNFSHGTHQEHLDRINLIRKVEKENDISISIMLDTKGPEIRLGDFANGLEEYNIGEIVTICKENVLGTHEKFSIVCPEIFDDIKVDDYILVNDGKQRLNVLENNGKELKCQVAVQGPLSSKKGCNVPGVKLTMPFLSKKDIEDIEFGCDNSVDFIAASFVRRKDDVLAIREILKRKGKEKINIIAKIENEEGFQNLEEILQVSDGVMVARGDLGVEVSTSLVPLYQKKIISTANRYGKCVITATHMLDSMTNNPRCTRAEASDVCNAILDGSDAVMLSAETAAGQYPIESVLTMAKIAIETEKIFPYAEHHNRMVKERNTYSIQDAIGLSITETSLSLNIAAIVVFTQGGSTAKVISKCRPTCPIYAVTFTKETVHRLNSYFGVFPVLSNMQNEMTNDDELASKICLSKGLRKGDLIILSAGYPTGEGTCNMMKIVEVK